MSILLLLILHVVLVGMFYWRYLRWVEFSQGPEEAQLREPTILTKLLFIVVAILPIVIYLTYLGIGYLNFMSETQLIFASLFSLLIISALLPFAVRIKKPSRILGSFVVIHSILLGVLNLYLGFQIDFDVFRFSEMPNIVGLMLLHGILFISVLVFYGKILEKNLGKV